MFVYFIHNPLCGTPVEEYLKQGCGSQGSKCDDGGESILGDSDALGAQCGKEKSLGRHGRLKEWHLEHCRVNKRIEWTYPSTIMGLLQGNLGFDFQWYHHAQGLYLPAGLVMFDGCLRTCTEINYSDG